MTAVMPGNLRPSPLVCATPPCTDSSARAFLVP